MKFRWLDDLLCATDLPALPPSPVRKREHRGDLGPNQIAWCEERLTFEGRPVFKVARAVVQTIEAEVAANRAKMEAGK
ncbi:MAG: hypothetical protein KGL39_03960 [Patescibacteria group bacterium]|nr:hypothetical protein [Patescibacteria group bacterium]